MKLFHWNGSLICCIHLGYTITIVLGAPQQPEINDQFENVTNLNEIKATTVDKPIVSEANIPVGSEVNKLVVLEANIPVVPEVDKPIVSENEIITPLNVTESRRAVQIIAPESFTKRICSIIAAPFVNFVGAPKVNAVLRNIGTCIVNGAMEVITYYLPAPLIPLIATAAGMVIPFEPVVMLREKMPVTSYRRAFRTALNSFLSTFDRYRLDDEDDDPYMTRRFNRRLMNDDGDQKHK